MVWFWGANKTPLTTPINHSFTTCWTTPRIPRCWGQHRAQGRHSPRDQKYGWERSHRMLPRGRSPHVLEGVAPKADFLEHSRTRIFKMILRGRTIASYSCAWFNWPKIRIKEDTQKFQKPCEQNKPHSFSSLSLDWGRILIKVNSKTKSCWGETTFL